ncbi:MAG: ABC transporter ATP-binding protein [Gammaproteobacteria bacterium]|nr:ABC transporter ATP-binding protein [Gammaproteobacteria bacterium]
MLDAFIQLKNLSKNYDTPAGSYPVLKNLNLSIAEAEFVALMGPSGSGKSTLMNILGCLDVPSSGKYFLDGRDVSELDYDAQALIRNHTIGFIFQGFNLLPRATLENNVALPLVYAGMKKPERLARARELLTRVGLGERLNAMPNEISGGEQQRVAIARSLANHPKLILADEPTGNLDTATSQSIMQLFSTLNRDGITIFLVTHEPDIALYAKRQVRLRDGVIVEDELTKKDGGQT